MKKVPETFEEYMRGLHCAQISFDELARWYYELKYGVIVKVENEEEDNENN